MVGPSSECVICLRESRARAQRRAVRLSVGFCVAALLVCGVVFGSRLLGGSAAAPVAEPSRPRVRPALAEAAPGEAMPARRASNDVPSERTEQNPLPTDAEREAQGATTAEASASATAVASASASAIPPQPASPARIPSQREVEAAVHATPVLMFSTGWCPHCKRARQFFQANGIDVVDRDIEADAAAASELKRRTGGKAIPLIDVDGKQLRGFDESETLQAVASSVSRRLGVSGVQIVPAAVRN